MIVAQLQHMKRHQQIFVVTHNADMVVNGDSELVVASTPHHGEAKKDSNGRLQENDERETICTVIDGNSTALEDRFRHIALR